MQAFAELELLISGFKDIKETIMAVAEGAKEDVGKKNRAVRTIKDRNTGWMKDTGLADSLTKCFVHQLWAMETDNFPTQALLCCSSLSLL